MKKIFFTLVFFTIINLSKNCLAWQGYDYENQAQIEIESGNLVKEGMVIDFFDDNLNEYRSAKVIQVNDNGHGSEVTLIELENDQERVFIME